MQVRNPRDDEHDTADMEDVYAWKARHLARNKAEITTTRRKLNEAIREYVNTPDRVGAGLAMKELRIERSYEDFYDADSSLTRPKRICQCLRTVIAMRKRVLRGDALTTMKMPVGFDMDEGVYVMTNETSTRFYVGRDDGDESKAERIAKHVRGGSRLECAAGLHVNVPLITSRLRGSDHFRSEEWELMLAHGIDNVASIGRFPNRTYAFQCICYHYDLCDNCGRDCHASSECTFSSFADWGHGFRHCGICGSRDHFCKKCPSLQKP